MKIAFVHPPNQGIVPPELTSLSIWSTEVGQRLAREHEVILYGSTPASRRNTTIHRGMVLLQLPLGTISKKLVGLLRRTAHWRSPRRPTFALMGYYRGYMRRVAADIARRGVDVVHIHEFSQFAPRIRRAAPNAAIALQDHSSHDWLRVLDQDMIAPRLDDVNLLLGCSDYVRDKLAGHFPQFADNCDSAYNGVDVEIFQPTRRVRLEGDPVRILYVGRLSPEKGVHVLIDAFREIALRHRQAQLTIAGPKRQLSFDYLAPFTNDPVLRELEPWFDGDGYTAYYEHLKRLVSRYGLENRVEFTGALPYSRVAEQYQQADVLAAPSFRESFGRSLIEAMACALPIVAADTGGMPEILDNQRCGLLFPAGRTEALTAALERLIESPELGRMMGAYGRRRAEEVYSWDAITDHVFSHYADMISGQLGQECVRLSS